MSKKIILLLSSSIFLASCSHLPDWLGDSPSKIDKSGKRIAVLGASSTLQTDPALKDVMVKIPPAQFNDKWYKSDSDQQEIPDNIASPQLFKHINSVSIGKGALDKEHLSASPVIANDVIYTIDSSGLVSAFSAKNIDKQLWKYKIELPDDKDGFANAGMVYNKGKLYLSTGFNFVYALDATNGNVLWKRTINSIGRSAPAANDNIVLVNTADNKLYALDANDGAIIWTHSGATEEMSVVGSSSPVLHGDTVFAPYSSGELYALRLQDSSEIWHDNLTSAGGLFTDIDASPVIKNNMIYAISSDGVLVASNIKTGERKWEKAISGNKTPWVTPDFIYLISDKNEIISIKTATGEIKWAEQLAVTEKPDNKGDAVTWSAPVFAGDKVLTVGSNGQMLSINPQDGKVVATNKIPKDIYVDPVVANDAVYLISDNGKLIELK
jgi:outer membrane protein assembly factor BamB